jgi:hypothetical protein
MVLTLLETPSSGFTWQLHRAPKGCELIDDSFDDALLAESLEPLLNSDDRLEVVGATTRRSLVVEIGEGAPEGSGQLVFQKAQPWAPESPSASYTLDLTIERPRRGVPEQQLALAAA